MLLFSVFGLFVKFERRYHLAFSEDFNLSDVMGNDPVNRVDPWGLAWSTADFVNHYRNGNGQPVNLGSVGLLGQFKSTDGVSELRSRTRSEISAGSRSGYNKTTSHAKPVAWSLGGVDVEASYNCDACKCKEIKCTVLFQINEWFSDPVELWEWIGRKDEPEKYHDRDPEYNPGGQPYQITATWAEDITASCEEK